jgi:hypothetical protein
MEDTETGAPEEATDLDAKKGADMIYAARFGDIEAVKALLADRVPLGFKDGSGWTALKWAASEGHEEVLALLLEHGAAEDEVDNAGDGTSGGGSSLHWAAYKGHVRLVWRLLTCKPKLSPRALDAEHNTPLHLASAGGHILILKTLLSEGVDVSLKNAYGNTALQLSTNGEIQSLLKDARTAALDGRPYLCSCSGEFCSEAKSTADAVIDRVSSPNLRPVRYSSECATQIRQAEDGLTHAIRAADVPRLQEAIAKAEKIGASLPMINEATDGLLRLQAQIALGEAVAELQSHRPCKERALLKPMAAPLKAARETGVAAHIIADADALCQTVDAEVSLFDTNAACQPFKMADEEEPPSAESDMAKRAEAIIAKLAAAIAHAQSVEAMPEVIEQGETELAFLTGESELRKALLLPKEGVSEDGTPYFTQYNGSRVYSALEDLQFRNDFLDASIEKCLAAGTKELIMAFAAKAQTELKAKLKQAQIEDEERKAKEAAAAAKAAKKKKGKK